MLKIKQANKRRNMYHFRQFVEDFEYYQYEKYSVKDNKGNSFKGYMYWLDSYKLDLDLLHSIADKYDNVELFKAQSQYAPEQIKQLIFIAN